jgi:putative methyltransferase (TIGR04325 family)
MPAPALLGAIQRVPPARALLRRRYARLFATARGAGTLSGVYPSFEAAERAAPAGTPQGYDHAAAGGLYRDLLSGVQAKDYPALYWLRRVLPGAARLFDLGGHVGVSFYAYRDYLEDAPALRWVVCDTPAVVREGEALARTRGASALAFTADPADADGADVLLASGSLQYIPETLDVLLGRLSATPRHLVVNQMPTHPSRGFVTLQNIGVAICPYRIAAVDALPAALRPLGYELVDQWDDPSRRTAVPYESDAGPIAYTGYYFRR